VEHEALADEYICRDMYDDDDVTVANEPVEQEALVIDDEILELLEHDAQGEVEVNDVMLEKLLESLVNEETFDNDE